MTAICIAGMHRSGTSLVARLLNLCELYLGQESELMPPSPDNLDGYWEHLEFVDINSSLLAQFGGSWYQPPTFTSFSDLQQIPPSLIDQAEKLIQRMNNGHAIWGWKDPRSCLTLAFWQQLIPDLKIIICLRNPLEVAHSMARRDNFPISFNLDLWHTYNQRLLSAATPKQHLITQFSTYFRKPQEELLRLLKFVEISPRNDQIERACLATIPSLKHHHATIESLIAANVPLDVVKLYVEMCSQAGPVYMDAVNTNIPGTQPNAENQDGTEVNLLRVLGKKHMLQLVEKEQTIQTLTQQIAEREHAVNTMSTQVEELNGIKSSRAWRLVQTLRQVRSWIKL